MTNQLYQKYSKVQDSTAQYFCKAVLIAFSKCTQIISY